MSPQREFVCYTDPSQFQDEHHRKQVKSYASSRAFWAEKGVRLVTRHPAGRFAWNVESIPETAAPEKDPDSSDSDPVPAAENECSLTFINLDTQSQKLRQKQSISSSILTAGTISCARKYGASGDNSAMRRPRRIAIMASPVAVIDSVPGIPHRQSQGFAAASEFYLSAVDPNYRSLNQIFNVVNIFGQNFFVQMQNEDSLHAGVAVMNIVRATFMSLMQGQKMSAEALRLVQIAMYKLRRRIARRENWDDDVSIISATFLAHLSMILKDMEAFEIHRKALNSMVTSRGGLDAPGMDPMLGLSVGQFDSWWGQLLGGAVFTADRARCTLGHSDSPFSADILRIVDDIPSGFQTLALNGRLSSEMIILLGRISHYPKAKGGDGLVATTSWPSRLNPQRQQHLYYEGACPSLTVSGPNFEKYLSYTLFLYCFISFGPRRSHLSACHMAFGTPKFVLTKGLPSFTGGSSEEDRCLIWMWLVLVDCSEASDDVVLSRQLLERFPACRSWQYVEDQLNQFFVSYELAKKLRRRWDNIQNWEVPEFRPPSFDVPKSSSLTL